MIARFKMRGDFKLTIHKQNIGVLRIKSKKIERKRGLNWVLSRCDLFQNTNGE